MFLSFQTSIDWWPSTWLDWFCATHPILVAEIPYEFTADVASMPKKMGFRYKQISNIQWIGLRENLQETMVFTIKYRAFLQKLSRHPILWNIWDKLSVHEIPMIPIIPMGEVSAFFCPATNRATRRENHRWRNWGDSGWGPSKRWTLTKGLQFKNWL